MNTQSLQRLSDRELLEVAVRAAAHERRSAVALVELLAEIDARRLYLGQGCSSLFTYCTRVLRLSEGAAYHRIEAARAIRNFPIIADWLRDGSITLTTVSLLRPHLTVKNHGRLLEDARHKSKREVEQQIARLAPRPEVAALVRRLPDNTPLTLALGRSAEPSDRQTARETTSATPGPANSRGPAPKIEPLSHDRFLLRVSLTETGHESLRRAQGLMRHSLPNGDLVAVVERALQLLVEHLERRKFAKMTRSESPRSESSRSAASRAKSSRSKSPRSPPLHSASRDSSSRHLPASVRRAVWKRDGGRCAFIGPHGRCSESGRLEFHHLVPFARGGAATASNIALRCRAHNAYEGELCFGPRR